MSILSRSPVARLTLGPPFERHFYFLKKLRYKFRRNMPARALFLHLLQELTCQEFLFKKYSIHLRARIYENYR